MLSTPSAADRSQGNHAGHVYDPAPASFPHAGDQGLSELYRRPDVDFDGVAELVRRGFFQAPGLNVSCVVNKAVNLITLADSPDQSSRRAFIGEIGLDELTRKVFGAGSGHADDLMPVSSESPRGRKPHPATGTGDDHRSRNPPGVVTGRHRLLERSQRFGPSNGGGHRSRLRDLPHTRSRT
jgi:hypothetical protein